MSFDETLNTTLDALRRTVDEVLTREVTHIQESLRTAADHERRTILEHCEQTARAAADLRAMATATAATSAELAHARREGYDEGFHAGRADGWDAGRLHGLSEGRQAAVVETAARDAAASARLIASIRQLDEPRGVPEMLDVLLTCAMREAARAAILIVRGQEVQGWKFVGFGARTENPTEFRQAVLGAGIIEEVIRTGVAASTHGAIRTLAPAFAELPLGRRAIAVPITIQGRVVAVLYADQGRQPATADHPAEGATWPASLEVMTRVASRCLEASGVLRAPSSSTAARTAKGAPVAAGGRR